MDLDLQLSIQKPLPEVTTLKIRAAIKKWYNDISQSHDSHSALLSIQFSAEEPLG